jgi:hypothetical protein
MNAVLGTSGGRSSHAGPFSSCLTFKNIKRVMPLSSPPTSQDPLIEQAGVGQQAHSRGKLPSTFTCIDSSPLPVSGSPPKTTLIRRDCNQPSNTFQHLPRISTSLFHRELPTLDSFFTLPSAPRRSHIHTEAVKRYSNHHRDIRRFSHQLTSATDSPDGLKRS